MIDFIVILCVDVTTILPDTDQPQNEKTTKDSDGNAIFDMIKDTIANFQEFEKTDVKTVTMTSNSPSNRGSSNRNIPDIQAKLDRVGLAAEESMKKMYASLIDDSKSLFTLKYKMNLGKSTFKIACN